MTVDLQVRYVSGSRTRTLEQIFASSFLIFVETNPLKLLEYYLIQKNEALELCHLLNYRSFGECNMLEKGNVVLAETTI